MFKSFECITSEMEVKTILIFRSFEFKETINNKKLPSLKLLAEYVHESFQKNIANVDLLKRKKLGDYFFEFYFNSKDEKYTCSIGILPHEKPHLFQYILQFDKVRPFWFWKYKKDINYEVVGSEMIKVNDFIKELKKIHNIKWLHHSEIIFIDDSDYGEKSPIKSCK